MFFLFAKLYQEYKRVDTWNPEERIVLYITFVMQCLVLSLFIPIWEIVSNFMESDNRLLQLTIILFFTILVFTIGRKLINKILFREKKMYLLLEKYKRYSINRILLYLVSIALPIFLLFLGPVIVIFFKGGEVLGMRIEGLIH